MESGLHEQLLCRLLLWAYELGANPHEALWYMDRFVESVDEEIDAGEFVADAEGVWDWMRKATVHDVAEELYNFLNTWEVEGHLAVLETVKVTPVNDYFYTWNEGRHWREILECWKRNGQEGLAAKSGADIV